LEKVVAQLSRGAAFAVATPVAVTRQQLQAFHWPERFQIDWDILPDEQQATLICNGLSFAIELIEKNKFVDFTRASNWHGLFCSSRPPQSAVIAVTPSAKIWSGRRNRIVNEYLVGIVSGLAENIGADRIVAIPSRQIIDKQHFDEGRDIMGAGGPLPLLSFVRIAESEDGGFLTFGLSYFDGQECRIAPISGLPRSDHVKLLARAAHDIAANGAVRQEQTTAATAQWPAIRLTPDKDFMTVRITAA
jgi:hypothetical protein